MVRATQTEIEEAVEALRAGDLVVFPTETVYGLGANASNPAAVRKIFEVKGRPPDHPVIVHLDDPRYLHRWVSSVPPVAEQLAAKFWPGPLTLIMPKADNVNDIVTGGQDSVGIRVPSHPIAQQLLNAFGGGIAAPSANRYGRLSPTKPEHVRDELGITTTNAARPVQAALTSAASFLFGAAMPRPAPREIGLCTMRLPPPSRSCRRTTWKCEPARSPRARKRWRFSRCGRRCRPNAT